MQLSDHHVGGGVVQAGDDQHRTRVIHWSLSLPVSVSVAPWFCPSGLVPVEGLVPVLVPWPGISMTW